MKALGKRQEQRLAALALGSFQIVASDRVAQSLARRGLTKAAGRDADAFHRITPAGLRALADAMQAGRLDEWTRLPAKDEGRAR